MKWIAEFQMPEDEVDMKLHKDAVKLFVTISDMSRILRQKVKYGESDERVSWEQVRSEFYKILEDNGVNLDDYG